MNPFSLTTNFCELSRAAGMNNAAALMLAHISRKISPAVGARLRHKVSRIQSPKCSQPVHLRLGTSDKDVFRQVFIYEEYAPVACLDDIRTIVDCGANIGLTSMYLLDHYPSARVLAIEPDPANAAICRRNLSPYGSRASVRTTGVWPTGSWENPALLCLERNRGDRRDWAVTVREARANESHDSTGVSFQAICDLVGTIDLLKIDIEGTEALIFSHECYSWLSRVKNIAIELHDDRCREAFSAAIAPFTFESSHSRESVYLKNISPIRRKAAGL